MEQTRPRVGVGVCIRKDGKVLMGKRKGGLAPDTWCFPGGYLEMNEHPETCAIRETHEETGTEIKNVRFVTFTNNIHRETGTHGITLFYIADWDRGDVQLTEPDKFYGWEWFEWDKLPGQLFFPTRNFLDTGINPLEI
jgi:8-oxo-dGTP diphosphatase